MGWCQARGAVEHLARIWLAEAAKWNEPVKKKSNQARSQLLSITKMHNIIIMTERMHMDLQAEQDGADLAIATPPDWKIFIQGILNVISLIHIWEATQALE